MLTDTFKAYIQTFFFFFFVPQQILAPYTDFHYRHNPDTAEAQLK